MMIALIDSVGLRIRKFWRTYSTLISVWKHVGNIEIDNDTRQNLVINPYNTE